MTVGSLSNRLEIDAQVHRWRAAVGPVVSSPNTLAAPSARVFSPLMAANATFALKAGLCVRRARLDMIAPDARQLCRSQARLPLIVRSEFGQLFLGCAAAFLRNALSFEKAFSIGLKSDR